MGLFDFLFKKNIKVSGTAKWVAESYNIIRNSNPELSHLSILELLNAARCETYRNRSIINELDDWVRNDNLRIGKGLFNYIYMVIQTESGICDLPNSCIADIESELDKAGIEERIRSMRR